ncbi:hypothetical protein E2C01_059472 [Portunus trituberculatus]|uniref:Uncharacterized protein n=1 Tax=Portunus trituberculatus TaxID=210409 RepID=A0A5B7H668_PORTR|nr:hypothetical protein [Portunus trituberculatus]
MEVRYILPVRGASYQWLVPPPDGLESDAVTCCCTHVAARRESYEGAGSVWREIQRECGDRLSCGEWRQREWLMGESESEREW